MPLWISSATSPEGAAFMPFTIVCKKLSEVSADAAFETVFADPGAAAGRAWVKSVDASLSDGSGMSFRKVIQAEIPSSVSKEESARQLSLAYRDARGLAIKNGCGSVVFSPLPSGGSIPDDALRIASSEVSEFLLKHDLNVFLAVPDRDALNVSSELSEEVSRYIEGNYSGGPDDEYYDASDWEDEPGVNYIACQKSPFCRISAIASASVFSRSLDDLVGHLDESFSDTLIRLIRAKGKSDVEVYRKANIDRRLFSKIRSKKGYTPKKPTILALAIALELSIDETRDLLQRAGYALSHASRFDVIVEYFIKNRIYDIFGINEILFKFDQPLLGG